MALSLSETQVALILSHAPDEKFDDVIEDTREDLKRIWENAPGSRAQKIDRIVETDAYDIEQLGWEIVPDHGRGEVAMATVTPLPDHHEDDREGDLHEITRQFVYEFKEKAIDAVDAVRKRTGLRPRVFTAAMISLDEDLEPGHEEFAEVAEVMGYTEKGLCDLIENANEEIEQAAALYELT